MENHDDFHTEPVPGLPEAPPPGEEILWQGRPDWKGLANRIFHARLVAIYFAVLTGWTVISSQYDGLTWAETLRNASQVVFWGVLGTGLLVWLGWASARATIYTITNKRLVIRGGIALEAAVNVPFKSITSAATKLYRDGTGDIPVVIESEQKLPYALLWPHVRPFNLRHPQPMLRSVPDAPKIAALLAESLQAYHGRGETTAVEAPERTRATRSPAGNRVMAGAS